MFLRSSQCLPWEGCIIWGSITNWQRVYWFQLHNSHPRPAIRLSWTRFFIFPLNSFYLQWGIVPLRADIQRSAAETHVNVYSMIANQCSEILVARIVDTLTDRILNNTSWWRQINLQEEANLIISPLIKTSTKRQGNYLPRRMDTDQDPSLSTKGFRFYIY